MKRKKIPGSKKNNSQTGYSSSPRNLRRLSGLALGAGGHHMTRLLALVADAILLTGTVTRQVTNLTTIITLLPLGAVAGQVTVTTARVASLLATTRSAAAAAAAVRATTTTTTEATAVGGALTSNVTNLTALIAFSTTTALVTTTLGSRGVIALAGEMASLATTVAGLLLLRTSAFTTHMSVLSAVVANRSSTLGAIASLMTSLAAVVAGTATSGTTTTRVGTTEIHCGSWS